MKGEKTLGEATGRCLQILVHLLSSWKLSDLGFGYSLLIELNE